MFVGILAGGVDIEAVMRMFYGRDGEADPYKFGYLAN